MPFGVEVAGLRVADLVKSGDLRHGHPFATALELLMAHVGLLVFRDQGVLRPAEQIAASALFGAGELHSTHGEHEKAGSEHIFRLSSSNADGIVGPGAEWHCDGSFMQDVFSHAGYHIVQLPENQPAGTSFAHLGNAYDLLSETERQLMRRMVSVNSNGGTVHPLVHEHPLSLRPSLFLHLAMTGAVLHVPPSVGRGAAEPTWTALDEDEVTSLFTRVNRLLHDPTVAYGHTYRPGDLVIIDNWAVAHKAFPGSFDPSRGVRVVHRTTVKSARQLLPPAEMQVPSQLPLRGHPPAHIKPSAIGKQPVWVEGYLGFRWRACEAIDLVGERSADLVRMQTPCFDEHDPEYWMRAPPRADRNSSFWQTGLLPVV